MIVMENNKYLKSAAGVLFLILITLFLIKVLDLSYPLSITTSNVSSELSVVGEGKVEAVPNIAYVEAGVSVSNGATVDEVQASLDKTNNAIIAAVEKAGVKKEDVSTSNYSINPNYDYDANANKISGYNGNVSITVKVKDTKLVSKIVGVVTAAGANQVNGVRFEIDNPDKLREEARNKAIQNAKDQAQKLAKTLGIRLGRIVNIIESPVGGGPIPYQKDMMAEGAMGLGGAPQIQPGTQTVSSTVTLYFEKK